jgi:hypothetical protein
MWNNLEWQTGRASTGSPLRVTATVLLGWSRLRINILEKLVEIVASITLASTVLLVQVSTDHHRTITLDHLTRRLSDRQRRWNQLILPSGVLKISRKTDWGKVYPVTDLGRERLL